VLDTKRVTIPLAAEPEGPKQLMPQSLETTMRKLRLPHSLTPSFNETHPIKIINHHNHYYQHFTWLNNCLASGFSGSYKPLTDTKQRHRMLQTISYKHRNKTSGFGNCTQFPATI